MFFSIFLYKHKFYRSNSLLALYCKQLIINFVNTTKVVKAKYYKLVTKLINSDVHDPWIKITIKTDKNFKK